MPMMMVSEEAITQLERALDDFNQQWIYQPQEKPDWEALRMSIVEVVNGARMTNAPAPTPIANTMREVLSQIKEARRILERILDHIQTGAHPEVSEALVGAWDLLNEAVSGLTTKLRGNSEETQMKPRGNSEETKRELKHEIESDVTSSGHDRVACVGCGAQIIRQPYMTDWPERVARFKSAHPTEAAT